MLFFCRDDLKIDIDCFVDGTPVTSHVAPPANACWRYVVPAGPVTTAHAHPQLHGDETGMSVVSHTDRFIVEDVHTGLEYAVHTARLTDPDPSVYLAFPDGPPPAGRSLTVRHAAHNAPMNSASVVDEAGLMCFCRGTAIRTPSGDVAVETLLPGDMVSTRDNGAQTIRWIGSRTVEANGAFAPVTFEPGTIGNTERLQLSPRHRVLVGQDGGLVLTPAQALVDGTKIRQENATKVEYFHIMFDRHEVIFANNAPVESYHPLLACAETDNQETKAEILALFPDLISEADPFEDAPYPVTTAEANGI